MTEGHHSSKAAAREAETPIVSPHEAAVDTLVAIATDSHGSVLALYDTNPTAPIGYSADMLRYYLAIVNRKDATTGKPTDITKIADTRGFTQCYATLGNSFAAFYNEALRNERAPINRAGS